MVYTKRCVSFNYFRKIPYPSYRLQSARGEKSSGKVHEAYGKTLDGFEGMYLFTSEDMYILDFIQRKPQSTKENCDQISRGKAHEAYVKTIDAFEGMYRFYFRQHMFQSSYRENRSTEKTCDQVSRGKVHEAYVKTQNAFEGMYLFTSVNTFPSPMEQTALY